jgi:poly(3-hydroxybutyrate) depolymerase
MDAKPHRRKALRRFLIGVLFALVSSPGFARGDLNQTETLQFGGATRSYHVFAPGGLTGPAPVILLLHGSGHSGRSLIDPWQGVARKEKIILVAPDAIDPAEWDCLKDSPDFLHAVLERVGSKISIDKRRVYLFGHSAGAMYALYLSIVESEYFAATAIHAGALMESDFRLIDSAQRKTPISIWAGTNDSFFPLAMARATRDAFNSCRFSVQLHEMKGHDHDYYGVAGSVNKDAWQFLKENKLDKDPNFMTLAQILHPVQRTSSLNNASQNADAKLIPQDFNHSVWERAKSYVDDSLPELVVNIPELRGLEPARDQERLGKILERTSNGCVDLLGKTPNLISRENVIVKFGTRGPNTKEQFDYLVLRHENEANGSVTLEEYRTSKTGAAAPVISRGSANAWVLFHPGNLNESRFRYMGHQILNGRATAVVGFSQIPEKAKFPAQVAFEGTTIPILFQGIAWIDESNFRIVRLRTDMLAPRPDIYLQTLTREVLFSEVRIQADETTESLWLPEEVEVIWNFRGETVRQLHRYSDYHLYHAKSKIVM